MRGIAERIREGLRKKHSEGVSYRDMAAASGTKHPTLIRFVDRKQDIMLETAVKLCSYLKIDL